MLFGCFMGSLMVFTNFNFFALNMTNGVISQWAWLGLFTFHKNFEFDLNCTNLQMSPKCKNDFV
jgi:hypothetical protein